MALSPLRLLVGGAARSPPGGTQQHHLWWNIAVVSWQNGIVMLVAGTAAQSPCSIMSVVML